MNILFYGDQKTAILAKTKLIPFESYKVKLPVKRPLLQVSISEAMHEILRNRTANEEPKTIEENHGLSKTSEVLIYKKFSSDDEQEIVRTEAEKLRALREEWEKMDKEVTPVEVMYV